MKKKNLLKIPFQHKPEFKSTLGLFEPNVIFVLLTLSLSVTFGDLSTFEPLLDLTPEPLPSLMTFRSVLMAEGGGLRRSAEEGKCELTKPLRTG